MATEKKFSAKLTDLELVLVCKECHWKYTGADAPPQCSHCTKPHERKQVPPHGPERERMKKIDTLMNAIANTIDLERGEFPFEVWLESKERGE